MIALLTPPPSPQAARSEELDLQRDLDFVINQERKPGQSFAYNLLFNDWFDPRRVKIHSLIPITSSLYLLSDSTTSLRNVLDHCFDRVYQATLDAKGGFPDEFRSLRPLFGDEFVRGMEKEFERGKNGVMSGLGCFFVWVGRRVAKGSKCNKISYEAYMADMITLPLLNPILLALKKPFVDASEVEELLLKLETSVPFVGRDVRVELATSIDDASRVARIQDIVDRFERHALYGETPPFLLLYPQPPPPPAPAPFIVHHPDHQSVIKQSLNETKELCIEFPFFIPFVFVFLAALCAMISHFASSAVVYYLAILTSFFWAYMPVGHLYMLFVYGGREGEGEDGGVASRRMYKIE